MGHASLRNLGNILPIPLTTNPLPQVLRPEPLNTPNQLRIGLADPARHGPPALPVDDVLGRKVPRARRGADNVHLELEDAAVQVQQRLARVQPEILEVGLARPVLAEQDGVEGHEVRDVGCHVDECLFEVWVLEEGVEEELSG